VKSGNHGRTGGRAERACGVSPFKKHSPLGQAFKIRSFIKSRMAIKSGVCPTQVVGHDEHDIGLCGKGTAKDTKKREGMEKEILRAEIHMV
jgi:hypothetical protein